MKRKLKDKIVYEGLGFPIELHDVEMLYIDGEWHPKIDVRKIADSAIKALASQKQRFTGNQIKFIRHYFSMSLRDFANEVVHESHTAVSKWEKRGDRVTTMDINIEKIIKLYLYEKIYMKAAHRQRNNFFETYLQLREISPKDTRVTTIQIQAA